MNTKKLLLAAAIAAAIFSACKNTNTQTLPEIEKSVLIPQDYIAEKSGHTRGSTIDLTLFDMKTGKEADMGCTFDYFGAFFITLITS